MVKYYSDCVGCADGCHNCELGNKTPHLVCDCCGDEVERLYKFIDGRELCADCLLEQFESYSYDDIED